MDAIEHYIQDAFELRAVAMLQSLAENENVAITQDSATKLEAFQTYLKDRNVTRGKLSDTNRQYFDIYEANLNKHLPAFLARLVNLYPGDRFDFEDVEAEARNEGRREDFLIVRAQGDPLPMSLKNYRANARCPQVCSGTYNSFIVNFVLEKPPLGGPGMVLHPSGGAFRGSTMAKRDSAFEALGLSEVVPLLHSLDALNEAIKTRFVYGADFEIYDDAKFDAARKDCGNKGADLAIEILQLLGADRVRSRVLTLAGLDDGDELLLMDPDRCTDSLSSSRFRSLQDGAREPGATVQYERRGQSIEFVIADATGDDLLTVSVPFTINKNGAWHLPSSGPYKGTQPKNDKGQQVRLTYGQRRPRKSKELATSVNTYVAFDAAGIFDLDAL